VSNYIQIISVSTSFTALGGYGSEVTTPCETIIRFELTKGQITAKGEVTIPYSDMNSAEAKQYLIDNILNLHLSCSLSA
jgi:hypothetical protein